MKIFGLEIRKAASEISSQPQIRETNPQGPMANIFQDYVFRKVSGDFYEKLREGIPMIDSAINRLISINGTIKIIGDDMDIVKKLEDICLSIPVNDTQEGIHAWHQNAWNETFEQGFSMSEFIPTPDMKDIAGMRVADSKNIIYRKNKDGFSEPWYRYPFAQRTSPYSIPGSVIEQIINATYGQRISFGGIDEVKLNPANKLYLSINNENTDPYGVSIMRSLEFCSQILVTLQNSIKNVAERFGDPMYHAHVQTKVSSIETARNKLEEDFKTVVNSKRAGYSGDLVTAGGPDSKVEIKVIGHDGQILTHDISLRHVLEQLVSKTGLPAWMLGIYWSTTERMATLEIESVLQDAKVRHLIMLPKILRLLSFILRLHGRKWNTITTSLDTPGDWGVIFEIPNLRDLVAQAQARFLNRQADMMGAAAGTANTQTTVNVGAASVEIQGMKFPIRLISEHKKELSRPSPWPALDKVEADYEAELKYDWNEFKQKVFGILNIGNKTPTNLPLGKGETKEGVKDSESFSFTEEQLAAIKKALKDYLGSYTPDDPDSPIRWYYGQAYSLGLIRAVQMLSKDRPILDILKNKEIFTELAQNGFNLLKDSATQSIINDIIPAMEAHMTAGSNPIEVAGKLEKLFGDQNSDWERLARSEMSMAAENAKLDEWAEWKVEKVEFAPAPDACAICLSLAGEYPIRDCPIPVEDTHPRCRCSIKPV